MWVFSKLYLTRQSSTITDFDSSRKQAPSKTALPTRGNYKPVPTTKLDYSKLIQCKPANPTKRSKRLKFAECNSPHPTLTQENKPPPPSKSAPPTGHLKSSPTTKLDNSKLIQCKPANPTKGSKRSKLADLECNSPLSARDNEPSAPQTGLLLLNS